MKFDVLHVYHHVDPLETSQPTSDLGDDLYSLERQVEKINASLKDFRRTLDSHAGLIYNLTERLAQLSDIIAEMR